MKRGFAGQSGDWRSFKEELLADLEIQSAQFAGWRRVGARRSGLGTGEKAASMKASAT
jgi:hypothetical protein